MQSKYKVLMNNTAVFAIGNILVKLISFVLMPLYTSVLTTEQYAVSELLNSIIEIVLPIMTLCMIEALYRFSIDETIDYSCAFMNALRTVLAGDVIILIICIFIYYLFDYQYSISFAILYISATFYKFTIQFARGLGYSKIFAASGVINALILVISNIILLVVLRGGVKSYLNSFAIAYVIGGMFAFVAAKEYHYVKVNYKDKMLYKQMLFYGIPNIPNMLAWWINTVSDRYIIMYVCGAGVAGLYTVASKLPSIINLVSSVFQQAWQYSTAKEIEKKDKNHFFSQVYRVYAPVCFVTCALLIVLTPLLSEILFQKEFYSGWRYVPFLLVAATVGCFSTFFGTFFNAVKKNTVVMSSTLTGAMVNIVLNFVLIPLFGPMAATITTVVSYIIVTVIRVICSKRYVVIELHTVKSVVVIMMLLAESVLMIYAGRVGVILSTIICVMIVVLYISVLRELLDIMCNRFINKKKA